MPSRTASPSRTKEELRLRGLRGSPPGVQFNAHLTHRGDVVFEHACKMGLEGIVSRRLGSRYRSGRTSGWLKFKNPASAGGGLAPGCPW